MKNKRSWFSVGSSGFITTIGVGVGIVFLLAMIKLPCFLEAQTRSQVSRVRADMHTLATAVESYRVENGSYPMMREYISGEADSIETLRYNIPMNLTTPTAFLTSYPGDPFSPASGAPLRYYTYNDIWLLYSIGPDKTPDIEQLFDSLHAITGNESIIETLLPYTYDPTNGTVSQGDVWRISE